jgi:glycerophosphoryl diester phosphodiesterase
MDIGADGFETDIHMTKDGVPVCSHGYTINSHSDGKGALHDHTLEDLKRFDFGSWKGDGFKGTPIATLDECLSVVKDSGIVNLELKTPFVRRREYVENVSSCLRAHDLGRRAIVASFDHSLLSDFVNTDPDCGIGALMVPTFKEIEEIIDIIGECFPADKPLDGLSRDDVTPLEDISFIDSFLGVEGADPKDVFLSLGKTLGSMFPGKNFDHVSKYVMSQADIPAYLEGLDFEPDSVFCHYISCFLEPEMVEEIHGLGKKVVVWTVDNPEHARKLTEMDVDGIITDEPAMIMDAINVAGPY